MEEQSNDTTPNETSASSNVKCLICLSREIVKSDKSTVTEHLKLFEQLIEQKVVFSAIKSIFFFTNFI